jgi:hypothetical protein
VKLFFRSLQGASMPKGVRAYFHELMGERAFDALREQRIIQPNGIARTYPCPGRAGGCPRRIELEPHDSMFRLRAVPATSRCCQPVLLTMADACEWLVSPPALVTAISEVLGVRGTPDLGGDIYPSTTELGRVSWRGEERDALLCFDLTEESPVVGFLFARAGKGQSTVAFTHARMDNMYPDLARHFGAGDTVEVVYLEDRLSVGEDGRLVAGGLSTVADAVAAPSRVFCQVVTADGQRSLDRREYESIVADRARFGLFLNLAVPDGARYAGGKQELDGAFHDVTLSVQHARTIAELVAAGRPCRVDEIRALDSASSTKRRKMQLEMARKEIDVRLSRYNWRSIQLHRRDNPDANEYAFTPPAGMSYAVLLPV